MSASVSSDWWREDAMLTEEERLREINMTQQMMFLLQPELRARLFRPRQPDVQVDLNVLSVQPLCETTHEQESQTDEKTRLYLSHFYKWGTG